MKPPVGEATVEVVLPALNTAPGVLSTEEQKRVNEAIERGVAYLRRNQQENGGFGDGAAGLRNWPLGVAALGGLALLECGIPATDPAIKKAAAFVREQSPSNVKTYELSLSLLFLDRLAEQADRPLVRSLALRLAVSQEIAGGWGYSCWPAQPAQEERWRQYLRQQNVLAAAKVVANEVAAMPRPSPKGKVEWSKSGDNSNTQFALLALWAARRYDLPLDAVIARVVERFRSSQLPGGWGYTVFGNPTGNARPYGSMTCAGLLALAVGQGWDFEKPAAKAPPGQPRPLDKAFTSGLQALAYYLDDPADSEWWGSRPGDVNLYFLWSVERTAVLCNLKTIGGKDWYRWGVKLLLTGQGKDGSWTSKGTYDSHAVGTSLALLFLRRADLVPGLGEKLRLRVAITDPGPPLDKRDPKGPKGAPSPGQATVELLPVDLGDVGAGATHERRFVLKGPQAFRVLKVEGADKGFAVEADSQPREAHTFTVTLRPDRPGTLTRTLRLRTDLPGREEITLTITARATPAK